MDKIAVVYWSGTGNTEAMAKAIARGIAEGGAQADVLPVDQANAGAMADYGKLVFGCPSMGDEVLEESEFEPFFASVESSLSGKKVALFGSYGWGDGQWMRDWAERTRTAGAILMEDGLIAQDAADEAECVEYGKRIASF